MQATATVAVTAPRNASLDARIAAYLVDSVILLSFTLFFLVIAGFQLLATSDFGEVDPPDSSFYAAVAILLAAIPAWSVFNLALLRWRAQTGGQYVLGIRVARTDGSPPSFRQHLARWLLLHPLLFHPVLIVPWGILSLILTSFTLNQIVLAVTAAIVFLCVIAPVAGLIALLTDAQRRALHDRLTGTVVVRVER